MLGSIFTGGFNINIQNSNKILCKLFYYISFLFSALLPTVLILASLDRLLISSQNVDRRLYSSKRLAYFSISISVCFWIIFLFQILIEVDIQELAPSVFVCYYALSSFYLTFITYLQVTINVVASAIMIVLSILAFKNVRRIRSIPHQQRNQLRSMNKKDFQLLRCLYAQDLIYIICTSILCINGVYGNITKDEIHTPVENAVNDFTGQFGIFLHHIPYCASFYIYISMSKAFRHELKRLIYKIWCKNLISIREEEHRQDNMELNVVDIVSTIVVPA
ncbi:unnamed protein product [Adineta steineri]|uniref:G-protein coupled receptors family 1 profile domain-containing protein n=1 Tax=Adineta steineri TaxID=433720 RepID=A0A819CJL4_9BILA|nr:unnamed protein product [Adineta steineri]CAF1314896.1 unnamed protein product [Adineta steineri]CAF1369431.1 unnamed protein product [Adineta steineri]CAF3650869.1 unnamed protein product [Adineta steineri]CAF3809147.1 unnamed protein product [Adineta steineri]